MIRLAQLCLVLAAAGLWVASRLTWVQISSFDGLGQPKTADLSGATWSTALIPLALLVAAAAVAALAVHGWPLRILALLVAAASAGMGYLAISLWVVADVAVRAAQLADVPVADLLDTERHYVGAALTLVAAIVSLTGSVLLMRSATGARSNAARYTRRPAAETDAPAAAMSERMLWDALDEGRDPTNPDNKGR
ncbi:TIGR02234 family membrane protein [Mycolicibacterium pyrenivorans]|uniref:TIGR02234 family membrane protein n=1 Tax=Mycolicibacterium pyrenivorans TaxID=187102 RepID=UPI0021F29145|nr:TIGR02234 family membrane protein [Mycolicibacterium pyrenivorans]MCV7153174.1 TIGR02234 family membrane protein [Mycolicibacterium pyrenivorans]